MRIDAHTHIGPSATDGTTEQLVAMLDTMGIDMALAYPYGGLRGTPEIIAANNDYILEAANRHPDRILGFCCVNPNHREEAVSELERCLGLGSKGLKLHPPIMGFDLGSRHLLDPLLSIVARYRVPVTIHCGIRVHDNPWRVALLADRYPDITFIMAHSNFGGSDLEGVRFAASRPNIVFDTSGTPAPSFIADLCKMSGNRVNYGSDWPALVAEVEHMKVKVAPVDEQARQALEGGVLARLFGLS